MFAQFRRLGLASLVWLTTCGAATPQTDVLPPAAPYVRPQTVVRLPDGRRFNMVCMGEGAPVAIILPGGSGWSLDWRGAQQALSEITRTCSVDRAGYGFSDAGPMPRDAAADVSDLFEALKASHMREPFVFVGHSHGGLELRLFAYEHPEMVSGLLLIDPSFEHFWATQDGVKAGAERGLALYRACLAMARAGRIVPGEAPPGQTGACAWPADPRRTADEKRAFLQVGSQPSRFETWISLVENTNGRTSDEVEAARRKLGSIPLIILSQDKAHQAADWRNADPDRSYAAWVAAHEDEARDSTRGEHRIVEGAGHWIYGDRPDAVVGAFREVVEAARASGNRPASN